MTVDVGCHSITTIESVRERVGEENPRTRFKVIDHLDETALRYVRSAPFLVLTTATADGFPDVSPKGDEPGFVHAVDDRTLLVPERKGNRMVLGLQNILANPRVALLFLVPGVEETLRVQGRADLISDPEVLERLSMRGQPALLAIRVRVERCFFHCAKAFRRSKLWDPAAWPEPVEVSFGKMMAPRLGGGEELARQIDASIQENYRTGL